jgi:translation elongation factor P/translation initiation factor 5A
MKLIDLLCVYKTYNDIVVIDTRTREEIACEKIVSNEIKEYLQAKVIGMRAIPYQSEDNAYFMDNEMRIMVKAKVNVWVEK